MQQRLTTLQKNQVLMPLFSGHLRLVAHYHYVTIVNDCVVPSTNNPSDQLVTLATDYHVTLHHALHDLQERYNAYTSALPAGDHLWPLSFSPTSTAQPLAHIAVDYQPTEALVMWFQREHRCDNPAAAREALLRQIQDHLHGYRWLLTYLFGSMPTDEQTHQPQYQRSWTMPDMTSSTRMVTLDLNPFAMVGINDSAVALIEAIMIQAALAPSYWTAAELQEAHDRHTNVAAQNPTQRLMHQEQLLANRFLQKLSALLPFSHSAMKPVFARLLHDIQEALWLPKKTVSSQLMRRVSQHSLSHFAKRQLTRQLPHYKLPESLSVLPATRPQKRSITLQARPVPVY